MRSWLRRVFWGVVTGVLVLTVSCTTTEVNVSLLHLEITSDAPEGEVELDKVRFLFTQDGPGEQARFPDSPDGLTLRVSDDFNPVVAPVTVALEYLGEPFGEDPVVRMQVVGAGPSGLALSVHERVVHLTDKDIIKVHLTAISLGCDIDSDGFLDCQQPGCCETTGQNLSDCEPDNPDANPWADPEDPCEECGDGVDQDCVGGDAICIDADTDGIPDCKELAAGCGANDSQRGPGMPERCDGTDNDCDQLIDEGFPTLGQACGVGVCEFLPDGTPGQWICTLDQQEVVCSTDAQRLPSELCGNGLDDNCNGTADEGCQITDLDGDGYSVNSVGGSPVDCNDHDTGVHPGVLDEPCCKVNPAEALTEAEQAEAERCDRNCDGVTVACDPNDLDGDGFTGDLDCDESDPLTYDGATEKCGDGIDQNCFGGDESCEAFAGNDSDGDGWAAQVPGQPGGDCDDSDPAVAPDGIELCNMIDDDCDGYIDEGNAPGADIQTGIECGQEAGECAYGVNVCVGSYSSVPGEYAPGEVACIGDISPVQELCDGLDNDCDGASDEDFEWDGLAVCEGPNCGQTDCDGTGSCGNGKVICTKEQDRAICSTMLVPGEGSDGSICVPSCGPGANCMGGLCFSSDVDPESCNGIDDDCDGIVDEGITEIYSSCYNPNTQENDCESPCTVAGVCGGGGAAFVKATCKVNPQEPPAEGEGSVPEPDDCWGWGWVCDYSAVPGYQDLSESECPPYPDVGDYQPPNRLEGDCDLLDNDCDGLTDEEFIFSPSCDGDDADLCFNGITSCDLTTPDTTDTWCDETQAQTQDELCDYEDNDCDDLVDEGFDTLGQACGIGVCSNGKKECTSTGLKDDASPWGTKCDSMPIAEGGQNEPGTAIPALYSGSDACDGLDDDCDGLTDENFSAKGAPCDGPDSDQCANGTWTCASSGSTVECVNESTEDIVDVCNNVDDDCDGPIDEALSGLAFITDAGCDTDGACGESGQTSATCGLETPGQWACLYNSPNYQLGDEVGRCDGLDNDCDGAVDEDFSWQGLGVSTPCSGVGECSDGVVVCNELQSGAICSSMLPGHPDYDVQADTCNGLDDDCDGQVDEALLGTQYASNCDQDGVCGLAGTIATCTGQGGFEFWSCAYGSGYQADNEANLCDGLDNDCDASIDEDFKGGGSVVYDGGPYGSDANLTLGQGCGAGACAGGVVECDGTAALTCSTLDQGSTELCNGLDDDCDGQVDDPYVDGSISFDGAGNPADDGKVKGQGCGWGQCAGGTVECKNGNSLACSTMPGGSGAQDSVEICDGQDNDCDGLTDEGYGWEGTPVCTGAVCETGACNGTGECGNGFVVCDSPSTAICSTMKEGHPHYDAPPQACNGKDDDCDGSVDENWAAELGTFCGQGECVGGVVECRADGQGTKCSSMPALTGVQSEAGSVPQSEPEACEGSDDEDCDGSVDEDWAAEIGQECQISGQGCYWTCAANQLGLECVRDDQGPDQTCDDVDNDCDGVVDQLFVSFSEGGVELKAYEDPQNDGDERFKGEACGTGACVGVVICDSANPAKLACDGAAPAGSDATCDNIDDDCDGQTDEDYVGDPITCGVGACEAVGVTICDAGSVENECTPGAKLAETDGTCDGVDDDCSGEADEDACDDGDPCTENEVCAGFVCEGTPLDCSDGLSCTADSCAGGACVNQVSAGSCLVGEACYADLAAEPDNSCAFCDATSSQDVFTPVADGTPCEGVNTCVAGQCETHACDDGFWNGDETDLDCGGSCVEVCGDGSACAVGADCDSGVCTANVCQAPSCDDGVYNGGEADEDCGGACPSSCANGLACSVESDCDSGVCTGNVCQVASCEDGVLNGAETGADCGGGACSTCLSGQGCLADSDCLTGSCDAGGTEQCDAVDDLVCLSWSVVDLIFADYGCTNCHGGSGGLSLTTYAGAMSDGNHGAAVIPGDAEISNLYLKLHDPPPFGQQMPKGGGPPLSAEELLVVEAWINLGANEVCPP